MNGTRTDERSGATTGEARPETLGDLGARSAAWASLRSGFVDVHGTQVHTIRGGLRPADGGADVPHLFIHGLGGGATNWLEVMGALGTDREVITMDLPGFGRTMPPRFSAARVRANARFIPAFMDTLGIERAIVHGNSMGGMLTALLAGIAPERIERSVMVAPALPTARTDLTHLPGPVFRRFAPFVVPGVGATLLRAFWSRADIDLLMEDALALTVADRDRLSPAMLAGLPISAATSMKTYALSNSAWTLIFAPEVTYFQLPAQAPKPVLALNYCVTFIAIASSRSALTKCIYFYKHHVSRPSWKNLSPAVSPNSRWLAATIPLMAASTTWR